MKQDDKKSKKKRSEEKNIDQGKLITKPDDTNSYAIRVRQSTILGRRTIRL